MRKSVRQSDSCVAHRQRLTARASCQSPEIHTDAHPVILHTPALICRVRRRIKHRAKFPSDCTMTALWVHGAVANNILPRLVFAQARRQTDGRTDCKIRRSCILIAGSCPDSTRSLHKCVWKFATKSDDTSASWKQQPAAVTLEHSHISKMLGHTLVPMRIL